MSAASSVSTTPAERRRVVGAVVVGTTIEWYDFFTYAFMANIVFAKLFFEPAGETVNQLLALLTIGLSFLFRPLGAFLAGHFGDKLGRRPMLVITLLLMGVATTAVGVLPTYEQAGWFAPIALIVLRILQGISAGGEWGGAVLMAVEHAPTGRRGVYGMFVQTGVPIGMLLATGVLALMRWLAPGDAFLEWGWRVPFLLSIVLIVVGYVVRMRVDESPVFAEIKQTKEQESAPIVSLFRQYGLTVVLCALVFAGNNAAGYMTTGGYVQGLASRAPEEGGYGFDPVGVQLATFVGSVFWLIFTFLAGYLSDRIGRKRTFVIGWAALIIGLVPLFSLVETGVLGVAIATSIMGVGLGLTYGAQSCWYAESFPASVRFSGVSISYAIGAIIGGAFAPSIAQALLNGTGTTWSIVAYLVGIAVISLVATLVLRERKDIPLSIDFEKAGKFEDWKPGDATEVAAADRLT